MISWQFWIDVGGTFTDCLARSPQGEIRTGKVLSSGITKGLVREISPDCREIETQLPPFPENFWTGYHFRSIPDDKTPFASVTILESSADGTRLKLSSPWPYLPEHHPWSFEIASPEPAPLLAMRTILGLPLAEPIPACEIRLGTTRGTNALLERKGARTALVTTAGFADILLIGYQQRPRLFELAIHKPEPLFCSVVEIDERLDAEGSILLPLDEFQARRRLAKLQSEGIESLAICLLHSFVNPVHEQKLHDIARELGFDEISLSSQVAPLIKIVSRGDTTVMDAYLNPVLREYVSRIRTVLEKGSSSGRSEQTAFKIMTSSGGLVDANHFLGKDSVLSGPAGGVIGFSRVAEQAGYVRSIGFDMGGTSTDVARYDGTLEREFETIKAGVRIVSPTLAIETVAAGGGSICGFDGVQLFVGPESAGADPGPACYGRGGPLTITDMNLMLGRLLPEEFPFPLDQDIVRQQLDTLCRQIADSPLGQRYSPHELALGFIEIANAKMASAIRKISLARGFDPAQYVLVTFGGAGGQHACAVADELGISRILVHPFAGILSAYGIGLADVRRHAEHSVLRIYSEDVLRDLERLFLDKERQLRRAVLEEGIPEERILPPERSLELRYVGQETSIPVPCPPDGDYRRAYEMLHQRLYGYTRPERELEIVSFRTELVGRLPDPDLGSCSNKSPRSQPARPSADRTQSAPVHFASGKEQARILRREELQPGDEIAGPAVLLEPTSTLVIEPGWHGTINEASVVLLQKQHTAGILSQSPRRTVGKDLQSSDPVMLELYNNQFASIAEQMGLTLQQTAVSTNVKERLDFSCAIFDPRGELVVNAPHIPVHLGAMAETVRQVLSDNAGTIQPGDLFVTNDPYQGGSHLPDVTVVTPVHQDNTGQLMFWVASRAHHAEIGGISPGSMPPFSKNLAEEGVLIRNLRLFRAGVSHEEELRWILTDSRYPTRNIEDNLADIAAQIAANNVGVRLLQELIRDRGLETVQAYMRHIQQAATEKMRLALARVPDGKYAFTDHLDDGTPIAVEITIQGESACVDFDGTGPVLESNLNANRAIVTAAVMYVFRLLIDEDIPLNGGVLAPIDILLPAGLLNPPAGPRPEDSPAMVGGNVETSQRLVDVLLGALGLAAASQGTMNNLTFGNERMGYYETICGGSGATADADGADAVQTHMTNTRLTDVEVLERRYPVRVREFRIRGGSGGAGRHSGGNGIVRRIEFLQHLKVAMLSQRRGEYPPFGLEGGTPGCIGRNLLQKQGEKTPIDLGGAFQVQVAPGDQLIIETPGGGGYGPPEQP